MMSGGRGFGDLEALTRKSQVLDDWCTKVGDPGRDPALDDDEPRERPGRRPGPRLELGFTDFVVSVQGPDWDIEPLRRALAWRNSLGWRPRLRSSHRGRAGSRLCR